MDAQVPQTLPVLQLELELEGLPNAIELPSDRREAKVETLLVTFRLWQVGQVTSATLLLVKTSCSNGCPQSAHTNS